jgi:hypothetical protein
VRSADRPYERGPVNIRLVLRLAHQRLSSRLSALRLIRCCPRSRLLWIKPIKPIAEYMINSPVHDGCERGFGASENPGDGEAAGNPDAMLPPVETPVRASYRIERAVKGCEAGFSTGWIDHGQEDTKVWATRYWARVRL